MELITFDDICNHERQTLIKPKNEEDQLLFEHCSGGLCAAIPSYFELKIKPLLLAHGVKNIAYKE